MDTLIATIELAKWLVSIRRAKHIKQITVMKGRYHDKFAIYKGKKLIGSCLYCPITERFVNIQLFGLKKPNKCYKGSKKPIKAEHCKKQITVGDIIKSLNK